MWKWKCETIDIFCTLHGKKVRSMSSDARIRHPSMTFTTAFSHCLIFHQFRLPSTKYIFLAVFRNDNTCNWLIAPLWLYYIIVYYNVIKGCLLACVRGKPQSQWQFVRTRICIWMPGSEAILHNFRLDFTCSDFRCFLQRKNGIAFLMVDLCMLLSQLFVLVCVCVWYGRMP